jgi:hypothetical protein
MIQKFFKKVTIIEDFWLITKILTLLAGRFDVFAKEHFLAGIQFSKETKLLRMGENS